MKVVNNICCASDVWGFSAPAVLFASYRCKSHCLLTDLARDLDKAERLLQ